MKPLSDVLTAFATERDRRVVASPPRPPDRTGALIAREWDGRCFLCGKAGMTLAQLVPHSSGGPMRSPNFVFSCRACHKLRQHGELDVLELLTDGEATGHERLMRQREDALMLCPQHPVPPVARRSLAECRAYFSATRWMHPRVPFLVSETAHNVLLAPLQLPAGPAAECLTDEIREAGGRRASDGVWSIGRESWNVLSGRLIDRHAILYRVADDAALNILPPANAPWRERWHVLYEDVAAARRDALRKPHQGFRAQQRWPRLVNPRP
jgi:hypothetical protein